MQKDGRDYFIRKQEEQEEKRDHWRLTAGISDFIAVVVGCAVALLLVMLLASLGVWLYRDAGSTFSVFLSMFQK